LIIKISKNP